MPQLSWIPIEVADDNARRISMKLDEHDFHYIVLSFLYRWMERVALAAATGTLFDFGAGGQPYRALFESKVLRYIAADVNPTPGLPLDIKLIPGQAVPLETGSVDTVLSSQTLEHVPDPALYLRECRRLLRLGGVLILTAPMQWRHHEQPYDYYRFTRYGLEHLVTQAGFVIENIEGTGGVWALIGQILNSALVERGVRRPRVFRLINRLALWLDRRYPDGDDTINWMCLARAV
jgi:SAM-dependent methyltransferase